MKKILVLLLCAASVFGLGACGSSPASAKIEAVYPIPEDITEVVCLLDSDIEDAAAWEKLASAYTGETGVAVRIIAADDSYETVLSDALLTMDAPTVFQARDIGAFAEVQDYCYDFSECEFFPHFINKDYILFEGDGAYAAALNLRSYGIAVNTALLEQAEHNIDEITGFAGLKAVAEDITAKRDVQEDVYAGITPLGFSAFCSAPLGGEDAVDFAAMLANMPLYGQYRTEEGLDSAPIRPELINGMKDFIELYINNSVSTGAQAAKKTQKDAIKEFTDGQAVFCLCRDEAYDELSGMENVRIIPLYMGYDGEDVQGLCTGAESYFCVNRDADESDLNATLDFLSWLVTSEAGKTALANDLGYASPIIDAPQAKNLFARQSAEYTANGRERVGWCFEFMPSEEWINELGNAVSAYASGSGKWETVQTLFGDGWTKAFELQEDEIS